MPLIDLKTNLKSLKYGNDRPGGGDSGQPYQKVDINTVDSGFNRFRMTKFDDGFVRGGIIGATNAAVVDTLRIGKFLTDLPKGPLWVVKQVGLQLSNPKLEVKKGLGGLVSSLLTGDLGPVTGGLLQPTRLYNLGINTLAQVPANAFGIHFNRHGLLPVQDDSTKYLAVARANNKDNGKNNRLVNYVADLLPRKNPENSRILGAIRNLVSIIPGASLFIKPQQQVIDRYLGGPGSVYGIGLTTIRRYDYTSNGINKQQPQNHSSIGGNPGNVNYLGLLGVSSQYFQFETKSTPNPPNPALTFGRPNAIRGITDVSYTVETSNQQFASKVGIDKDSPTSIPSQIGQNVVNYTTPASKQYADLKKKIDKQTKPIIFTYNDNKFTGLGVSGSDTYNGNINSYITTNSEIVYKNGLKDKNNNEITVKISGSWSKNNRENRVGSGRTDSINLTPIFSTNTGTIGDTPPINIPNADVQTINDLVKFRIQAIDSTDPNKSEWMIFRAYITQFTDNTDATWNEIKYAGRGDRFYVYDGFTRKISIGFKVAALSAVEMEPMYQKLNFLMGNLMPDYNNNLMRGPLVKMTVGNWIDGQPGILNNISYTVPQDSPWEIGLADRQLILPHVLEVSMTFTPIGSQTQNTNKVPSKSQQTSNIAQNYNGANNGEPNYIKP
jgi:hypothetical protein